MSSNTESERRANPNATNAPITAIAIAFSRPSEGAVRLVPTLSRIGFSGTPAGRMLPAPTNEMRIAAATPTYLRTPVATPSKRGWAIR